MMEYTLIPTQSAAADVTTGAITMGDATWLSVHADFTGSDVVGTVGIYGSNDGSDFVLLATATAVSTSTSVIVTNTTVATKYARVFWDYTSGTGNITVKAVVKSPLVTLNQG